jgi:hypothetical protein
MSPQDHIDPFIHASDPLLIPSNPKITQPLTDNIQPHSTPLKVQRATKLSHAVHPMTEYRKT